MEIINIVYPGRGVFVAPLAPMLREFRFLAEAKNYTFVDHFRISSNGLGQRFFDL